jgi:hypothetical protein
MSSLFAGQRPLGNATEHGSSCIVGKSFLGNVKSSLPSQRVVAVESLRSKPFQNASISTSNLKSTGLLSPKAALIEPETYEPAVSTDNQISYLQDLVSRLRQAQDYAVKVTPSRLFFPLKCCDFFTTSH